MWLTNGSFSVDTSYFPTISRYYYSQKRTYIIEHIESNVKYACTSLYNDKETSKLLDKALTGINNIKKIYPEYNDKLDEIINMIKNR